jgi:hypothetical protein
MADALVNGTAYSYVDVTVRILGVEIHSIAEIKYKSKQEKVNNYGAGDEPVSRGKGIKEYEAELKFSKNDYLALRAAVPSKELLDLPPFDIPVTFGNEQRVTTDVLQNCEFLEEGEEIAQGDMDATMTFPLIVGKILYDA